MERLVIDADDEEKGMAGAAARVRGMVEGSGDGRELMPYKGSDGEAEESGTNAGRLAHGERGGMGELGEMLAWIIWIQDSAHEP